MFLFQCPLCIYPLSGEREKAPVEFWGFNRRLFVGFCSEKDYTVRISFSLAAKSSSTFFRNLSWSF